MVTVTLTIPEIAALAKGGDERVGRAASRLGLGEISEEVAQAGVCSLFVRGLLEGDGADGIAPTEVILAAVGLIADSTSTLRLAVVGDGIVGTSHVHVVDDAGVLVTPIGFGCFHFSFLDASDGLAAIVRTAGEAALDRDDRALLVSLRTEESETSMAVRRIGGAFELSDSESGTFTTTASPWDDVATRLSA